MLLHMRTSIVLDDKLYRDAKALAAKAGTSLKALVEEALQEILVRRTAPQGRKRLRLVTFGGRGPHSGLNVNSNADLYDFLDREAGAGPTGR